MKEVLPGIWHWTAMHDKIHVDVSSYYVETARVLIDPLVPAEGIEWFRRRATPEHVLLTNRHHWRHSGRFVEAFRCDVRCHRSGLHEFHRGERVEAFEFGDELPGGIEAVEIGALCPDETALHIPGAKAVAFADGLVREDDGPLSFVPDEYMGEDPERVKAGLQASFRRLLELDFDHLLLAHGMPWIGGGKKALRKFAGA